MMPKENETPKGHRSSLKGARLLRYPIFIFNVIFSVLKNLLLVLVIGLFLFGFLGAGIGIGYFASLTTQEVPLTGQEMKEDIENLSLISSYYYGDGSKISDIRSDELRIVTTLDQVSPYVIDGLIATEDAYFYQHHGIVPKALFRALLQELVFSGATSTSGGSTITQQLVKQQILSSEVTFKRKANEILYALRLEKYMTKDQILEAYLNVSPFGRNHNGLNISGIEEAAQGVFGVSAKDLTLPQAAFLVGLPQNPIIHTPYTNFATLKEDLSSGITRQQTVLFSMYREKKITKEEYEAALAYDISQDFLEPEQAAKQTMTYLYQAVDREATKIIMAKNAERDGLTYQDLKDDSELNQRYYEEAAKELSTSGYKVTSTVDPTIYQAMQEVSIQNGPSIGPTYQTPYIDQETGQQAYQEEPAQNGSVLIENATGKILGFIAGRDFETNQVDHAFSTHRSPGSTIKPLLVYAPAIENNLIYPASIVPDTKISIKQLDGSYWEPTNYGNRISNQLLTVRHSLKNSLNNPTIKIYQYMLSKGIQAGNYLALMGIESIAPSEYQNIALSIGGTQTGPSVMEQTSAFSTLANKGIHRDAYLIEKIEDAKGHVLYQHENQETQVFSEATAYLTLDILREVAATKDFYNIQGNLPIAVDLAGKTGTSEFELDNWFIGFTPEVTLGSWIGYDNFYNASYSITASDGYGHPSTRSLRTWTQIMAAIQNAKPELFTGAKFEQPSTVYRDTVVAATGTKPGKALGPNNIAYTISGQTSTDLFKTDYGPLNPTYNFVIGGSDSDLQLYWRSFRTSTSTTTSSSRTTTTSNSDDNQTAESTSQEAASESTQESSEDIEN